MCANIDHTMMSNQIKQFVVASGSPWTEYGESILTAKQTGLGMLFKPTLQP